MGIEDLEKVENKVMVNEDDKMGKEDVGIEVEKEVEKKEKGNEDNERSRG